MAASLLASLSAHAAEQPSGPGPASYPYPSGLTVGFASTNGSPVGIGLANRADFSGPAVATPTAAMFNPVPLNTNSLHITGTTTANVTLRIGAFSNGFGTLTISFGRPVTNPRLHFSGIAGQAAGGANWGLAYALTTPGVTLTTIQGAVASDVPPAPAGGGFSPTQQTIRASGASNCSTFGGPEWCGTVQANGTVTSLTFNAHMHYIGSGVNPRLFGDGLGDSLLLMVTVDNDYSDAPIAGGPNYGTATHVVGGLTLGTPAALSPGTHAGEADRTAQTGDMANTVATLLSPNPVTNANATGDTDNAFASLSRVGVNTYTLAVPVTAPAGTATVCGWIDFNRNGEFTDGSPEEACTTSGIGTATLAWTIPTDTSYVAGESFLRLRASYNATQGATPTGVADSGEVEDYRITLDPRVRLTKALAPTSDPGLFNLSVGPADAGAVATAGGTAANVGHAGTTGRVPVLQATGITFGETAGTGTSLAAYSSTRSCVDRAGNVELASAAGTGGTFTSMTSASTSANVVPATAANSDDTEIICTITNAKTPTVAVQKTTVNSPGGAFNFTAGNLAAAPAPITTAAAGTPTPASPTAIPVTTIGTPVTLSESPAAGWVQTGISCTDTNAAASGNNPAPIVVTGTGGVTLPAGSVVAAATYVCVFTNAPSVDLQITKTNTPGVNGEVDQAGDTLLSGSTSTYTLVVTNAGPGPVTGAVVRDAPGAGLTCPPGNSVNITGSGLPTGGPFTIADLTGTGIVLGTLSAGQSTTLTFSCTVL